MQSIAVEHIWVLVFVVEFLLRTENSYGFFIAPGSLERERVIHGLSHLVLFPIPLLGWGVVSGHLRVDALVTVSVVHGVWEFYRDRWLQLCGTTPPGVLMQLLEQRDMAPYQASILLSLAFARQTLHEIGAHILLVWIFLVWSGV